MEQLAQKHTNERTASTKSQDRELENLKVQFDKDLEKLRQQQKTDLEKRVKFETNEEKKFLRGLKDKQDHEMKQFLSQQRVDYRATKTLYKKVSTSLCATVALKEHALSWGCVLLKQQ